jgi:hypothetical protein
MTPRTMRKAERGVHLIWALVLVLYVYGFLPSWGEPVVRWAVIPGIVASGFAMWFAAPLRKVSRRMRAMARPALGAEGRSPSSSFARRRDDLGRRLS